MSELSEAMSVLPVEQRTIVRHSADNLREEFRGTFGVETIELYLASSLLALQAARIKKFVSLVLREVRPATAPRAGTGGEEDDRNRALRRVPLYA